MSSTFDFLPSQVRATVLAIGCVVVTVGHSQPSGRPTATTDWTFSVGGGVLVSPAFPGASDYQVSLVPDIRASYRDLFTASVDDGARYHLIKTDNWRVGPLLGIDFGRDQDGSSPFKVTGNSPEALKGLPDIETTLEGGMFAAYEPGPWTLQVDLVRTLGEHEGLHADLSLNYRWSVTPASGNPRMATRFSTGPRLTWADTDDMNAYFGVSTAASAGSGLPAYQAQSGVRAVGWGLNMIRPLNDRWAVLAIANFEQLTGDAADSPLVRQEGEPKQFTAGLFVSYRL